MFFEVLADLSPFACGLMPSEAPLDLDGGCLLLALLHVGDIVGGEPRHEVELPLQGLDLALDLEPLLDEVTLLLLEGQEVLIH